MKDLSVNLLGKRCQLRLPFGICARDNQTILLVKDADAALPVKIELAECLRVYQTRQRYYPGPSLANPGGNTHLVGVVGLVLGNRLRAALVIVQRTLCQTSQCVESQAPVLPLRIHARQVVGMEKAGQEFHVAAAVWEIGETEVSPRVHAPIAIAVVDDFHRNTIGIGKVLVKVGGAPQCLERRRVVRVLPVKRHLRGGYIVVARGWRRPAVLSPVSVWCLLLRGEAMQNPATEIFPLLILEYVSGQQ